MKGLLALLMISRSKHAFSTRFLRIRSFLRMTCVDGHGMLAWMRPGNGWPPTSQLARTHTHLDGKEVARGALPGQVHPAKGAARDGLQHLEVLDADAGGVPLLVVRGGAAAALARV